MAVFPTMNQVNYNLLKAQKGVRGQSARSQETQINKLNSS